MTTTSKYSISVNDPNWGCTHVEIICSTISPNIKLCHVKVSDIKKIALELTNSVLNTSWIMNLDQGTRRSYEKTAAETAHLLVDIFNKAASSSKVAGDFGELLVSIGSARALELIFDHIQTPIAELWKPQKKQNEGFDFHTTCPGKLINFGEAKYSSKTNPHGDALSQAHRFIRADKHFRDRVHLINLVHEDAIENLDNGKFGIVAAFSLNSTNPLTIFDNALVSAKGILSFGKIETIYLVGVSK